MSRSIENETWFVLGSFPELSAAEISAVLSLDERSFVYKPPFLIIYGNTADNDSLMLRLGGTVKIAKGLFTAETEAVLIKKICANLANNSGKITFGISNYYKEGNTAKFSEQLGKEIKKNLKQQGLSVRYVFNSDPILSSVTVSKNGLTGRGKEFIISKDEEKFFVAATVAVQPYEDWGSRDFGRPERDDVSGMLPPKLARIMLNLSQADENDAVLDPFCGSGTIITEALTIGMNKIIGSDSSEKAINDTRSNIDWLISRNKNLQKSKVDLFSSDITDLTRRLEPDSIDAIITEPYLGKPLHGTETVAELKKQAIELSTLYRMAFVTFKKIVKKNGRVVIIFPRFRYNNEWITINILDSLKILGFTPETLIKIGNRTVDSLPYSRPNQKVGREIWRFKKN
ncbi:MAG: methyltransferase domain-containing protein [Candidatus Magasanikbacteria bacterium]|nr:methyltransferase domain-containing protein [Candidatus Magasanikbacteria bacterium]